MMLYDAESIRKHNEKLSNSIIDNSKNMYDDEVYEEIKKRIPIIDDYKILEENNEERVRVIINIPYKILKEFEESIINKYGRLEPMQLELKKLIINHNEKFNQQQHTTTSSDLGNGKSLRKDVLKNLLKISMALKIHQIDYGAEIPLGIITKTIGEELENPDDRTEKKYVEFLKNYSKTVTEREFVYGEDIYVKGLEEKIREWLGEKL